ncbi:MAG: hypothetical protein HQ518_10305 [Rhodopirellula sp.]|nr:hypothetical protein [Rhodopirellula sp.]
MSTASPVPASRPIPANLLMRACEDDPQALETMFRQFLPEDEPVLFARYMGKLGFWWFGSHSLACLTSRRVATLRVGSFGEVLYQEGQLEDINSAIVYQPSKLGLYINIIFSVICTFGVALLFLPLITKTYYSVKKCGLVFWVAEGVSIYIFCNRKLIRKANELMRRSGLAREARVSRVPNSDSGVQSIVASPVPLTPSTEKASERPQPTYRQFEYAHQPGTRLVSAFKVVLILFALALTGLAGSGVATVSNEFTYPESSYYWDDDLTDEERTRREEARDRYRERQRTIEFAAAGSAISGAVLVFSLTVLGLVWLGRSWSAAPRQYRFTSPSRAVGLMFVPLFNFFWAFHAFPGLAKSLDWASREELEADEPTAGHNWAVATAILFVIPFVNVATCPFVFFGFMKRANAARDRLITLTAQESVSLRSDS